jgi:pimeloyl-ACP methyl ester carboxylesterase
MNRKFRILIIAVLFSLLCLNVFAQQTNSFQYTKTGKGRQALIFIPGFACSGRVWNETVQQFADANTCYTITFKGFAGVAPQTSPQLSTWVADLAAFIKDNHIDKPIVIGHSLGGIVAMWLAADHPDLISKIVVVDALPCLPALRNPAFTVQEHPGCDALVKQFSSFSDEQFATMQKRTMPAMLADSSMLDTVVNWSVTSDRTTFAQIYCQLMNTDLRSSIASIKCPSLVLLEPSFKQMEAALNEQYKLLPGKTIRYAEKGLHFIMFDDKDWYMAQLKSFIP